MNTRHDEIRIGDYSDPKIVLKEDNDDIISVEILEATNMVVDTLPVDELTAVIKIPEDPDNHYNPNDGVTFRVINPEDETKKEYGNYLVVHSITYEQLNPLYGGGDSSEIILYSKFVHGLFAGLKVDTPVWYIYGDRKEKFYFKSIKRTGKYQYTITAQSAVGVIQDKSEHNGGYYERVPFSQVLSDILSGNSIVNYEVDADVAEIVVNGHLPIANRRDNLHALLFAYSVVIRKVTDETSPNFGNMRFCFPTNSSKPVRTIPNDDIFDGDSLTEEEPSGIEFVEHSYTATPYDEYDVLFDNTDGTGTVTNQKVIFDSAPIQVDTLKVEYDPKISNGLVIEEKHCNYAVVTGSGKLLGKPYVHSQRTLTIGAAHTGNVTSITDNGLINVLNSNFIARRLYDYCLHSRVIEADISIENERPGDIVRLEDAYGTIRNAYIQEMRINPTSFAKASCKLLADYTPKWLGNSFNRSVVITPDSSSQSWIVPEGVTQILFVLGAGGQGGYSGTNGGDATFENLEDMNSTGVAGEGGEGGVGGSGGKILVKLIDVTTGQRIICQLGTGGAGGIHEPSNRGNGSMYDTVQPQTPGNSIPGELGTDTSISVFTPNPLAPEDQPDKQWSQTIYSTADAGAYISEFGFKDLLNGVKYSFPGPDGYNGLRGRDADTVENDPENYPQSIIFGTATYKNGADGLTAEYRNNEWTGSETESVVSRAGYGGRGGGAAIGNNGGFGGDGRLGRNGVARGLGGDGGNGADASYSSSVLPPLGCGGHGGHGGGGGGAAGNGYDRRAVKVFVPLERDIWGDPIYSSDSAYAEYRGDAIQKGTPMHGKQGLGGMASDGGKGGNGYVIFYYRE